MEIGPITTTPSVDFGEWLNGPIVTLFDYHAASSLETLTLTDTDCNSIHMNITQCVKMCFKYLYEGVAILAYPANFVGP